MKCLIKLLTGNWISCIILEPSSEEDWKIPALEPSPFIFRDVISDEEGESGEESEADKN